MMLRSDRQALIDKMRRWSAEIRRRDVVMIHEAGMGHVGGDLSATDILVTLFAGILNVDPSDPKAPERDRFIMSKGHASGSLYNVLAQAGFLDVEELKTYMRPQSRLNGHPDSVKVPGVEASTGPLGHGLPIAVGAALAAKLQERSWRTYALLGDGELQEGSNWEAAMAASHYGLDNLTAIVDRNGIQQGDFTESTIALEPLAEKWRAFGWSVVEVDGHDIDVLFGTFSDLPLEPGRPSCVIAKTHKGRGVSFMEDQVNWHHRVPTAEELERALAELGTDAR